MIYQGQRENNSKSNDRLTTDKYIQAAIIIQKYFRKWRKFKLDNLQKKLSEIRSIAACIIQKNLRTWLVQKELKILKCKHVIKWEHLGSNIGIKGNFTFHA